jgi:hypothetical protein
MTPPVGLPHPDYRTVEQSTLRRFWWQDLHLHLSTRKAGKSVPLLHHTSLGFLIIAQAPAQPRAQGPVFGHAGSSTGSTAPGLLGPFQSSTGVKSTKIYTCW